MLRTADRNGTDVQQRYSITYDDLGNMTSVRVGNKLLTAYEYDSRHRLIKQTYGNGQVVNFTYDEYDRVKTATYPDGRVLRYRYNGDGAVHSIAESGGDSDAAYVSEYDSLGRLITSEKVNKQFHLGNSQLYATRDYDNRGRLIYETWKYPMDLTFGNRYAYNLDNGTMTAQDIGSDHVTHSYDSLLRMTAMTGGISSRTYTYRELADGKTTSQVTKLAYPNLGSAYDFEYTYDIMGNIASYITPSGSRSEYTYDDQGQLLRADCGGAYVYSYDAAGNLLTADLDGEEHTYTYGDGDWKDLLTAYDNQPITYDGAGNPLSYYNGTRWNFTWANGRQLKTAGNGTDSISYTYTADGLRTSKTVNGTVHTYYYSGGLLRRETYGNTTLDFFYDANGTPFSLLYNRSTWYYYITNLEGDVIRLVDIYGQTAAMYKYDPFGNAIYATGSHAQINPLRYRSYYFDSETGMYYLQSRYYDPQVGRFVNADTLLSTGDTVVGYNMFAYCSNSPTNSIDATGHIAKPYERDLVSPGGAAALSLYLSFFPIIKAEERAETFAPSKTRDADKEIYTVYFLKETGGATDDIVYVGRVKTKNYKARMDYHETRGREPVYCIDNLYRVECRFIEQAGMAYHHTIRKGEPLYNQIRGISIRNGKTFEKDILDFASFNNYEDNTYLPKSYILNQYENWLLNKGQ